MARILFWFIWKIHPKKWHSQSFCKNQLHGEFGLFLSGASRGEGRTFSITPSFPHLGKIISLNGRHPYGRLMNEDPFPSPEVFSPRRCGACLLDFRRVGFFLLSDSVALTLTRDWFFQIILYTFLGGYSYLTLAPSLFS